MSASPGDFPKLSVLTIAPHFSYAHCFAAGLYDGSPSNLEVWRSASETNSSIFFSQIGKWQNEAPCKKTLTYCRMYLRANAGILRIDVKVKYYETEQRQFCEIPLEERQYVLTGRQTDTNHCG